MLGFAGPAVTAHNTNQEAIIMKIIWKPNGMFVVALLLAALVAPTTLRAGEKRSEDQLIEDLKSPKDGTVVKALQDLEKQYPTSTKALPAIKALLKDPRPTVRRKAARVLGVLHAELDTTEIQTICELLKSNDWKEVVDILKALRNLKSSACVPAIVECLHNPDSHVIRDACRTLAIVGTKDQIKSIEPLLTHPEPAVQKDAQDAIFALKNKS
jgi:HEAT repeat protein